MSEFESHIFDAHREKHTKDAEKKTPDAPEIEWEPKKREAAEASKAEGEAFNDLELTWDYKRPEKPKQDEGKEDSEEDLKDLAA